MEGVKEGLRSLVKEPSSFSDKASSSSSNFSSDQSRILIRRTQCQVVSVWTCTKLCTVGFLVGVIVGYTLKRRVRQWAAKILRRLKDD